MTEHLNLYLQDLRKKTYVPFNITITRARVCKVLCEWCLTHHALGLGVETTLVPSLVFRENSIMEIIELGLGG